VLAAVELAPEALATAELAVVAPAAEALAPLEQSTSQRSLQSRRKDKE